MNAALVGLGLAEAARQTVGSQSDKPLNEAWVCLVGHIALELFGADPSASERITGVQPLHQKLVLERLFVRVDLEALAQMQPNAEYQLVARELILLHLRFGLDTFLGQLTF